MPSEVLVLKLIVGFCEVLQTTPRALIAAPPSLLIVPPEIAELEVINLTSVVVSVANVPGVV